MNYKNISFNLLSIFLMALLVTPGFSFAQRDATNRDSRTTDQDEKQVRQQEQRKNICDRFSELSGRIRQRVDLARSSNQSKRDVRKENHSQRINTAKERLQNHRSAARDSRNDRFEALRGRAQTPEQRRLVQNFTNEVEALVAARIRAVDAANADFKTAYDSIIASYQTKVESAKSRYSASVESAISQAKSDCEAGIDVETVKKTLQDGIHAAQAGFQAAVKEAREEASSQLNRIKEARKQTIEEAFRVFRDSFKTAAEELKAALRALEAEQEEE